MTKYDYSSLEEEQMDLEAIVQAIESGEIDSIPNLKQEIAKHKEIAKATLNKTRNMNLRMTERDMFKLKRKALEEGIPYQTLASSIIHKYVNV